MTLASSFNSVLDLMTHISKCCENWIHTQLQAHFCHRSHFTCPALQYTMGGYSPRKFIKLMLSLLSNSSEVRGSAPNWGSPICTEAPPSINGGHWSYVSSLPPSSAISSSQLADFHTWLLLSTKQKEKERREESYLALGWLLSLLF